jgi:hypothetical protein
MDCRFAQLRRLEELRSPRPAQQLAVALSFGLFAAADVAAGTALE